MKPPIEEPRPVPPELEIIGEADGEEAREALRQRVIGLGDYSPKKSHYPQLRQRVAELERFRALLDETNDAIFLVQQPEDRFADVNESACRQLGLPRESLLGTPAADVGLTAPRPGDLPAGAPAAGERPRTFAATLRRNDGTTFPAEVTWRVVPLSDAHYAVVVARDVTERLAFEAHVHQAQKLESLGLVAGGVAHDFNNLLVGMLGNATLALDELPPDSSVRPLLQDIELAARRAAELTNQLLAYAGHSRFEVQPLALSALVREMLQLLRTSIPRKVALGSELPTDIPRIEGNAAPLRQIVMNLVINAAEAIGEAVGSIQVRTGLVRMDREALGETLLGEALAEGPYVFLEVEDTGCGMRPETILRIFDPFFTTKFTGRGLGLSAVLGIVRAHRGAVRVLSTPGVGTCIRVLFPPVRAAEVRARPVEVAGSAWQGEGACLVVDDEAQVARLAQRVLERCGFEVCCETDAYAAVHRFEAEGERFRFVLLDLKMPGLSGEEVLERIRALRPDVPVVLSSGYGEQEVSLTGRTGVAFIQKPYRVAELTAKVRDVLG